MSVLLNHPAVHALGVALLHFLWQGILLAALLLAANAITRPSQARLRYALACIAMLLMPILFGVTIFRVATSAAPSLVQAAQHPNAVLPASNPVVVTTGTPRPDISVSHVWDSDLVAAWAVFLWLTGVVVLAIWTFVGWGRTRHLTRYGIEPATPVLLEMLESLRQRLKISKPVELCVSAITEVPAVIGWLRPYILLPVSAITGLSESELRAILAHELAHIRRHDYLVNLLQNAVETLLFYHPAVWWVSRRIRAEREHCCDDIAVAICGDARAYAGALTQLEELRGSVGEPALAATGGDLLGRIRRLLGTNDTRLSRIHGAIGSLGVAALVIATTIITINSAIQAQTPRKPLEFEVASIKPIDPNFRGLRYMGVRVYPGGRVVLPYMVFKELVVVAFHVDPFLLSGGEPWMLKDQYTVEGKPPQALKPGITNLAHSAIGLEDERLRGMLQALLIDRFHLKFHRETKPGKVYLLERTGKKVALKPSADRTDPEGFGSIGYSDIGFAGGRWVLGSTSMPQLASFASRFMRAPVLDRTGITLTFDFKEPVDPVDDGGPLDAVEVLRLMPQLGVKLTPSEGLIETFVIDHAEKPTEN